MLLIESIWKIVFDPSGTPLTLLDYGDYLAAEPIFGGSQAVRDVAPLGYTWGRTETPGGALLTVEFEAWELAATTILAREAILAAPQSMPWKVTATLQITVQGGSVGRNIAYASLSSGTVRAVIPDNRSGTWVVSRYAFRGGQMSTIPAP
jgi:hypothetical protein